jgi:hypothetical protein
MFCRSRRKFGPVRVEKVEEQAAEGSQEGGTGERTSEGSSSETDHHHKSRQQGDVEADAPQLDELIPDKLARVRI